MHLIPAQNHQLHCRFRLENVLHQVGQGPRAASHCRLATAAWLVHVQQGAGLTCAKGECGFHSEADAQDSGHLLLEQGFDECGSQPARAPTASIRTVWTVPDFTGPSPFHSEPLTLEISPFNQMTGQYLFRAARGPFPMTTFILSFL